VEADRSWPSLVGGVFLAGRRPPVRGRVRAASTVAGEGSGRYDPGMPGTLTIATADPAGVATIVDWAAAEGWNPGLGDAAAFRAADPTGFLLGSIDGEPVGAISVVSYDESFCFLGLYIVRPEWRGQGHGLAMWRAGVELAGSRTIGLDGVVEHQGDYARSGFVLVRRNIRFGGVGGGRAPGGLVTLDQVDPSLVVDYDAGIFPVRRERFLATWLRLPGSHGVASIRDGNVAGYGVARPCRVGVKVGPLFADDEATAEALYAGLAAWTGDKPIFLDAPESNAAALRLAERHGLSPVFETARMYRGVAPDEPVERIFGVTTFELG
jgi:ribosomal protein S18 acetylase RimI-like enzyme